MEIVSVEILQVIVGEKNLNEDENSEGVGGTVLELKSHLWYAF